jgi:hypothetical protein
MVQFVRFCLSSLLSIVSGKRQVVQTHLVPHLVALCHGSSVCKRHKNACLILITLLCPRDAP